MSLFHKKPAPPPHPESSPVPEGKPTLAALEKVFKGASDFTSRSVMVSDLKVTILCIDGLINSEFVTEEIIRPLTQHDYLHRVRTPEALLEAVEQGGVYANTCKRRDTLHDAVYDLLGGFALIVAEDASTCLSIEAKGFPSRSISESTSENTAKGAKDSFVEALRLNTALVRRKIKNPALRFTDIQIGRQTATSVSLVWLEGLTNPELVQEVESRLRGIDIDSLLSASHLEEYLVDNRWTPFPQMVCTERSDKFSSHIVSGRVVLLVDGLPISYTLPGTLHEFLQAPEDFSSNYLIASCVIILRYTCLLLSLALPALYLSMVNFHQEIIPTALANSIIAAKQDVPLGSTVEVLGMLLAFEILLEAGMRLPKSIGQTVSIVGGLVMGQAAVEAKFVSPAVVIIVAITGVAGFTLPNQDLSAGIRIWRFILTLLASQMGLYSFMLGIIILLYHWAGIESFGVSYLRPFSSDDWRDMLSHTVLRPPRFLVKWRERSLGTRNQRNQK